MSRPEHRGDRATNRPARRGFTLIELLVVMLIILLVSVIVLPTTLQTINHWQISEAARILQAALAAPATRPSTPTRPRASGYCPIRC